MREKRFSYERGLLFLRESWGGGVCICVCDLQPFAAHLEHLSKRRNRQVVTKQMLLNSKCLEKLVLWFISVVRFAVSLLCLQCSKLGLGLGLRL